MLWKLCANMAHGKALSSHCDAWAVVAPGILGGSIILKDFNVLESVAVYLGANVLIQDGFGV